MDTYTRIHFENKYKDVYTIPTAAQQDIFDIFKLEYCYKGHEVNAKPADTKSKPEDVQDTPRPSE